MMDDNWAIPSKISTTTTSDQILTDEQIRSWREDGFALVDGLISPDLVQSVFNEAMETLRPLMESSQLDFGSGGMLEFPSGMSSCDDVSIHPNLLQAASELLKIPILSLRLCQSDVWMKCGKEQTTNDPQCNNSQRVHCDYGNNTLVHPPSWDQPEAVAMIVYYSDAEETGGSTALAPRLGPADPCYQWPLVQMPGIGGLPFFNDKDAAEAWMKVNRPEYFKMRQELYNRELRVKFKPGTVLLYRHDVYHRGTPVFPGKTRIVQNLAFRRSDAEWITCWNKGFARFMYGTGEKFTMEHIIGKCTVEQRTVLGFPAPGHRYWNAITLDAVNQRYQPYGFDRTPYEEAFN